MTACERGGIAEGGSQKKKDGILTNWEKKTPYLSNKSIQKGKKTGSVPRGPPETGQGGVRSKT